MRGALRVVLDLALPQLCPSCREPVSEGKGLCAPCWSKLSLIEPPYCMRLGIPFAYDPGPGLLSMEAIANPPAYNRARAVARYDDIASTLVHGLKYSDRLDLSPMMGRWTARAGRELLADVDALVPVPLHWRRRWARRYINRPFLPAQYRRFAGSVSRTAGSDVSVPHRSRSGGLEPSASNNVRGAFLVPPEYRVEIAGRRLVLVDDVLTSGATVDACTRTLWRAGAAQVDVLVRVVAPARSPI
jgi:predicted amidophosphoribosyltransferase